MQSSFSNDSLPSRASRNPRGGALDDELSMAESFLANLRSNVASQPQPPTANQTQNETDGDMNRRQRFTPRIASRESARQAVAESRQQQVSRGSSRGNLSSRGSNRHGDEEEEEDDVDKLTARARRWSTSERGEGWKWDGRPTHRDALGSIVLKQAEQAEALKRTKQGLEELEKHSAAFDVYLRAASVAKDNEKASKKVNHDSESSSDDGIDSDDEKYEQSADILSDETDEEDQEIPAFFITEVAGQDGSANKKSRGRKGLAVDEEGDVIDVQFDDASAPQVFHQKEEEEEDLSEESQYRTCLNVLDQSRQRVKEKQALLSPNSRHYNRPTSPATLKLFQPSQPKLVSKLTRRVQGAGPGSAPAIVQRGAPSCIERSADAKAKITLIQNKEEKLLKQDALFTALPIPDMGPRRRRGGRRASVNTGGEDKLSPSSSPSNSPNKIDRGVSVDDGSGGGLSVTHHASTLRLDHIEGEDLTVEEKKARRALDRKRRAEAAKREKEIEIQSDGEKKPDDLKPVGYGDPLSESSENFDYFADTIEDKKPLFERQSGWKKHIKSRQAREGRKKKEREAQQLEAEMKEEKDRRQYAMQYWNKARELAEKAKRERETEEVERELAAEQRRCILKAKADELVKQTAAKRRAKRSESQAEAKRIEAEAKLRKQKQSVPKFPVNHQQHQQLDTFNTEDTHHFSSMPTTTDGTTIGYSSIQAPLSLAEKAELEMELFLRQHQWMETEEGDGVANELAIPPPPSSIIAQKIEESFRMNQEHMQQRINRVETGQGPNSEGRVHGGDSDEEGQQYGFADRDDLDSNQELVYGNNENHDHHQSSPQQASQGHSPVPSGNTQRISPIRTSPHISKQESNRASAQAAPSPITIKSGVLTNVTSPSPNTLSNMLSSFTANNKSQSESPMPQRDQAKGGTNASRRHQTDSINDSSTNVEIQRSPSASLVHPHRISPVVPSVSGGGGMIEPWERFDRARMTEEAIGSSAHQMPFFDLSSTNERGRFRVHDARGFESESLKRQALPAPHLSEGYSGGSITLLIGKRLSTHHKFPNSEQVVTVMFDRDPSVDLKVSAREAEMWWQNHKGWLVLPDPI